MQVMQNNNKLILNGYVQSPIVLHSDREIFIAQNAHNLVWQKYRNEFDSTDDAGRKALTEKVKPEINELIIQEISTYRESVKNNPFTDLIERIEALEEELKEVRELAEEALDTASEE